MIRRPPISTRTDTLFPYTTLFRSFGAGWMKTDYEESGIPYDSPGTRIERMTEALTIMKTLWEDGECTFAGKHYRSEEHTSELQSLMRISYAVFCLKKKK